MNVGFGFKRDAEGILKRNNHKFDTYIHDTVEIGRQVNIDQGSWRNTEIHEGTKIDSLAHIAHNVIIHEHCLIIAGAIILGSAEIGKFSYIGGGAIIKQRTKIGEHVIVGMGAVVIKDVKDNDIVAGNPAKSIKHKIKLTNDELWDMVARKVV